MALNVFFWSSSRKNRVVWTFCLTKPHVFVCFFRCMLCNSSCYDFSETNKVLSYEWVIISVSLKFFQNLELFIIWQDSSDAPPGWCLICRIRQILFVKIFSDWIYSWERHAWCSKSEILEMTKDTPNHQLKRCCSSKRAIIHQKITKSNYFEDSWSKWEKSYCWHKKIFFRFSKFEKFRKPSPFLNRFVSKKTDDLLNKIDTCLSELWKSEKTENLSKSIFLTKWSIFRYVIFEWWFFFKGKTQI